MNYRKATEKIFVLVVFFSFFTTHAYANGTMNSLQEEHEKQVNILAQQEEKKQMLEKQMDETKNKLQEMQQSIDSLENETKQVEEEIIKTTEKLNEKKEEIISLEDRMYQRKMLLEERLVSMQKYPKDNIVIEMLLDSRSIGEMLQRARSIAVLFEADINIIKAQQTDVERLEKIREEITENEQASQKRQKKLEEKQDELAIIKSEQQKILIHTKENYQQITSEIQLTKTEQKKIEAKLVEMEAEAKKKEEVRKQAEAKKSEEVRKQAEAERKEEIEKQAAAEMVKQKFSQKETTTQSDDKEVGQASKEGKEIYVTATAYTGEESQTGLTAIGYDIWKNPSMKLIAVDPNVIPLGSKVWVEGYGEAIAGDTGGAIVGYKIDILLPTVEQATAWGRRDVKLIILDK